MQNQSIVRVVVVFAILVLVNVIAVKLFTRLDLTSNKAYTLSQTSRTLVKSLDDKFVVKAYFTGDLPSPWNNNRRYLQDQLDEYRAYGNGNFQYEFVDPSKNKDLEGEAQKYGIPQVRVQVVKDDKMSDQLAFMGVTFLYGDKHETLPVVQNLNNLEYEISSTIKKMTSKELKKVGFMTGHGEPEMDKYAALKDGLEKQYTVTSVDLKGGRPVPQDLAVLVIAAPAQAFKDWEKFLIDQYIVKGGHVAFLLNEVSINLQSQQGAPTNLQMDDLLAAYGIRVNTDLVRDARCAMVRVQQNAGYFMIQNQIPFPYLPMASEFDKQSPIVKDLSSVIFYFASSIDTNGAKAKGLTTDVLIRSSKKSGRQENFFMVNPGAEMKEDMFKESGIPLAVTVEGDFPSAYAQRTAQADTGMMLDQSSKVSAGNSKIAVVGDGDFAQDGFSGGNKDNIVFATNLIDYLADDIGLASIRSRDTAPKPLDEVSESTRGMVKYATLFLPPFLMIGIGVVRWRWRASVRKKVESQGI